MLLRRSLLVPAVAGLVVTFSVAAAQAQVIRRPPQQQPPQQQAAPFTGVVKIEAYGQGMFKVNAEGGEALVMIKPGAKVRVTGTAQADYLKRGQLIRFNASVDVKTGKVQSEVKKITIFTPSPPEFQLGKVEDAAGAAGGAPATGDASGDFKPFILSGTIKAVVKSDTGHKFLVMVPTIKKPLEISISDDVSIDVDTANFNLVKQGDSIEIVKGQKAGPRILADEAKIVLANPLTGPAKRGHAAPPAHGKKPDAGTEAKPDAK
jgi:hypothetical protein